MDADRAQVAPAHGPRPAVLRGLARGLASAGFAAVPVLFLCLFLVYPLSRILALGLGPVLAGGLRALAAITAATDLGWLLLASAEQALLSTALTLAVGLPAAYVFGRYDFPGKAALRIAMFVPFVLPTMVVSSAFIVLIGGLRRTLAAVLMAHVFYNVAIVVRIVGGALSSLDPRLGEAARMLGAGRFTAFRRVTLRLLLPSLAASSILVFAFCFSSFGVILVLGGPRMGTLETEIYRQAVYLFSLPTAAVLSAVQLAATGLVMYGYSRFQARMSVIQNLMPENVTLKRPRTAGERLLVMSCGVAPTVMLMLPMAALVFGSFMTRAGPSLAPWKAVFGNVGHSIFWSPPLAAAGRSLLFALEAMAISLALGIPAAYLISRGQAARGRIGGLGASALDIAFLLPLGTSAVTLGFGFIVSLNSPPLDLVGTKLLIPISHALVALPLVVRSMLAPLRSINPRMREAAALLGAGPARVRLEIDLPMLRRAFIAAAAFAFTVSLGEFGATAILTRPELVTLPVLIYDSLSRPGGVNQGQALALSTMLMLACAGGLAAIERFREPRYSAAFVAGRKTAAPAMARSAALPARGTEVF